MIAFALSSLLGMVHEATTRHVVCAHGEMIHGDAVAVATDAPVIVAHDRTSVVRELPAVASDGHEHCALASALRESRVAPRPSAIGDAPVAVGELAVAAPRPVAAPDRGLYHTAPKTSPPA